MCSDVSVSLVPRRLALAKYCFLFRIEIVVVVGAVEVDVVADVWARGTLCRVSLSVGVGIVRTFVIIWRRVRCRRAIFPKEDRKKNGGGREGGLIDLFASFLLIIKF